MKAQSSSARSVSINSQLSPARSGLAGFSRLFLAPCFNRGCPGLHILKSALQRGFSTRLQPFSLGLFPFLKIITFLLISFVLSACAPRYGGIGKSVASPGVAQECWTSLQTRYPSGAFRLKQRLALRALGKQYDMIGYLVVRPGGDFRAIAMGEMGGRVFDLALEQGQSKVYKKPDKMPPRPLLDGIIGDIRHLFSVPPESAPRSAGVSTEQGITLSLAGPDRDIQDYSFRIQDRELSRSLQARGRRVVREAEFSDYKRLEGFDRPIPTHIVLKNHRWHYTLEIQTLEILPGAPGEGGAERP